MNLQTMQLTSVLQVNRFKTTVPSTRTTIRRYDNTVDGRPFKLYQVQKNTINYYGLWVYSYSYFLQLLTAYSILSMVDSKFFSPNYLFVRILYSNKKNKQNTSIINKNKDKTPI